MNLNTDYLKRQIKTMQSSLTLYNQAEPGSIEQEIFQDALLKCYELTQEIAFKLLKKALKDFGYGSRKLDTSTVKEILRLAANHGLMTVEEVVRWFAYRDNLNVIANDNGEASISEMVVVLPAFIADVTRLECLLREQCGDRSDDVCLNRESLKLPQRYLEMLLIVFKRYVPEAEVWAYGSRVNGDCHEASDLDLVVRNIVDLKAEFDLLDLKDALVESNLPIRVDVVDWARIPDSFRREIERSYVVVQDGREE